jgi:DNA-binding MarR family transcriptional regulator
VQRQADGQGALADRLGVDRTVMTYLVDDLEKAGLVERRADPLDRRSRRLVATPLGQQRWAETERRLEEVEEQVLAPLVDSERETFRNLLQRLAARATELDPVESACAVANDVEASLSDGVVQ